MAENLKKTIRILKEIKANPYKHHIKKKWQFYLDYAIVILEEMLKRDVKENPPKRKHRNFEQRDL